MSSLLQFVGANRAPASLVNAFSSGTPAGAAITTTNTLEILSGAVTSGNLKTVLSHTGAGAIKNLVVYTKDSTSRTVRLKLTLDGVAAFDSTTAAISSSNNGMAVIGSTAATPGEKVFYNSSLTVEVASSLSETDKIAIGVVRETYS